MPRIALSEVVKQMERCEHEHVECAMCANLATCRSWFDNQVTNTETLTPKYYHRVLRQFERIKEGSPG